MIVSKITRFGVGDRFHYIRGNSWGTVWQIEFGFDQKKTCDSVC
jgi:hypothetical protein